MVRPQKGVAQKRKPPLPNAARRNPKAKKAAAAAAKASAAAKRSPVAASSPSRGSKTASATKRTPPSKGRASLTPGKHRESSTSDQDEDVRLIYHESDTETTTSTTDSTTSSSTTTASGTSSSSSSSSSASSRNFRPVRDSPSRCEEEGTCPAQRLPARGAATATSAFRNAGLVEQLQRIQQLRGEAARREAHEVSRAQAEARDRAQMLKARFTRGGADRGEGFSPYDSRGPRSRGDEQRTQRFGDERPTVVSLRQAVGLPSKPAAVADSALIVIDVQNTYTEGPLKLHNVEDAIRNIHTVLHVARRLRIPIFHVRHHAGEGTLYDVHGHSGAFVRSVAPVRGEYVITKSFPNSFEGTTLLADLQSLGIRNLILVGAMTHCCINSTARAAFNNGFVATVIADCCATRSLPDPTSANGLGTVSAASVHRDALAAVADLHAIVVPTFNEYVPVRSH